MYLINKYERKMEDMHKLIEANKNNISTNTNGISKNKEKLDEHYNHIEKLWVSSPSDKKKNNMKV